MSLFKNLFRSSSHESSGDLTTISRTQVIDGFSIPGIIKNGSYFFTDLQVYHDGMVYCWEMVDLEIFQNKLNSSWVVTFVPDGKDISFHGLGSWTVEEGQWLYDKETYFEYIRSLVRRLNPQMENLIDLHGRTTEVINGANIARYLIPNAKPYYISDADKYFPKRTQGERYYMFFRDSDTNLYLTDLSIFPDGHVEITHLPEKKVFRFSDLWTFIDDKKLMTEPPTGERIHILGLGSFINAGGGAVSIEQKYQELLDHYNQMFGKEGSIEKCRRILEEYQGNPSEELKEQLKQAYEAIPDHNKCYVGDMDTRDTEVRRILYGEDPDDY